MAAFLARLSILIAVAVLAVATGSWHNFAHAQTNYRLAVGDMVEFDFLHDSDEPHRATIADDGRVQLPLIGGVAIAGLPLSEAQEKIRNEYETRQLLVNPMVSLSIADYRPIFVLGDVRSPGSYPFRPLLTVEQAVGLAGGPSTLVGNEEDRILLRQTTRNKLSNLRADLAREAIWVARLKAQIDGRHAIDETDVPGDARPLLEQTFMAELKRVEEQILDTEQQAFERERELLKNSIGEAEEGMKLLDGLVENQKRTIGYFREQVQRSKELQDRGITAQSEVSRREQQVLEAESRLLQVYGEISRSRRSLSEMRRQLDRLEADRNAEILLQLQTRQVEIEKLLADYRSHEDRLTLLASWTEADIENNGAATFRFAVRRNDGDQAVFIPATAVTQLVPGDVLSVAIERPERERAVDRS
ncbi:MAG: polysaccharide biosynthesis/export family protein [Pseudomonadota bacterium]